MKRKIKMYCTHICLWINGLTVYISADICHRDIKPQNSISHFCINDCRFWFFGEDNKKLMWKFWIKIMIDLNVTLLYVLLAQQAIDQLNHSQNVLHKKSSGHREQ